jgi:hypothetical protein
MIQESKNTIQFGHANEKKQTESNEKSSGLRNIATEGSWYKGNRLKVQGNEAVD